MLRVAQPATTVIHPLPPPLPAPVAPVPATPLLPAATAPAAPLLPAPAPLLPAPAPLVPFAPQYSYVLRPGNAVQTSYFATYPRYPVASYRPLAPAPGLLLSQPPAVTWQPQAVPQLLGVAPTPALLHPAQVDVSQAAVQVHNSLPDSHAHIVPSSGQLPVAAHALDQSGWAPLGAGHSFFTQEAGTQVYEQHEGVEQALHGYHDQLPLQQEQAHYDHHQHGHEHAAPAPAPAPSADYGQPAHEYAAPTAEYGQPGHDYDQQLLQHQQQLDHQYSQQFGQHEHFTQHDHQFAHPDQHSYDQQYAQHQQAASFEGQELQGRSADENEQRYHNHIPLGLQPPIDRPLEHFR